MLLNNFSVIKRVENLTDFSALFLLSPKKEKTRFYPNIKKLDINIIRGIGIVFLNKHFDYFTLTAFAEYIHCITPRKSK